VAPLVRSRVSSPSIDARFNGHPRNNSIGKAVHIVDCNLYWDALHDLRIISGRIVGWQKCELGP
jgi:hypothetical protein